MLISYPPVAKTCKASFSYTLYLVVAKEAFTFIPARAANTKVALQVVPINHSIEDL